MGFAHVFEQAIYFGAVSQSIDLAREEGPYATSEMLWPMLSYF